MKYREDGFEAAAVEALKDRYDLSEGCVKVWQRRTMDISDVVSGIKHVKSIGFNTIVYNCIVPLKERLSKEYDIDIIDGNDLIVECIRNEKLMKYSGVIRYE